jgi:hypothetical protein
MRNYQELFAKEESGFINVLTRDNKLFSIPIYIMNPNEQSDGAFSSHRIDFLNYIQLNRMSMFNKRTDCVGYIELDHCDVVHVINKLENHKYIFPDTYMFDRLNKHPFLILEKSKPNVPPAAKVYNPNILFDNISVISSTPDLR